MDRKIVLAVDLLASLRLGQWVHLTENGRTHEMYVSREIRRADGDFGSYESSRVTVTFGVGQYACEVTAERLAAGTQILEIIPGREPHRVSYTQDAAQLNKLPNPALIVLIGASGAGKSTMAQARWPGKVLSSDVLREMISGNPHDQDANNETFTVLNFLIAGRLKRKLTTVVDATSATPEARQGLVTIGLRHRVPVVAVVLHPPLETCLTRNAARTQPVPPDVVCRQHASVSTALGLLYAEGFANVIALKGAPHVIRK